MTDENEFEMFLKSKFYFLKSKAGMIKLLEKQIGQPEDSITVVAQRTKHEQKMRKKRLG